MYVNWVRVPHALYLCLEDGRVVMRASHDGVHPAPFTPIATDQADIAEIERCFAYWYDKFGLPEALNLPTHPAPKFVPTGDPMADIECYLRDGSPLAFHELFGDDGPMVWIDWREDDADIVKLFARVLVLDNLSAEFLDGKCDLLISYRSVHHRVSYPQPGSADRDTTIRALNHLLTPDYEIRFSVASNGSDTLAFLPLSAKQWSELEHRFPRQVETLFAKLGSSGPFFG